MKEDAVVKIDAGIYGIARSRMLDNPIEYPSIKNFIEKAIVGFLGAPKSYNIEGISETKTKDIPLQDVVKSTKDFVPCLLCERMFLKNKIDKSEGARVCPNCKNMINYFKGKI